MQKIGLDVVVVSPAGTPDARLAIGGSRAGAIGIVDLEFATEREAGAAVAEFSRLADLGRGRIGVLVASGALLEAVLQAPVRRPDVVVLAGGFDGGFDGDRTAAVVDAVHRSESTVFAVVRSVAEAVAAEAAGVDAVIAKGHESGGWVGEEGSFVLLQRLVARLRTPVWAQGGVGLHTAAACLAGGAAGVVLDSQLLLARESPLGDAARARVEAMDGSETVCLGTVGTGLVRTYHRPGLEPVAELRAMAEAGVERVRWHDEVGRRVDWRARPGAVLAIGQDASFAADLARRFTTVGGIVAAVQDAAVEGCRAATQHDPLAEGSPWAIAHGVRYPIAQGPMTRVSDRAEFAEAVVAGGGLPFLALALMRAPEVEALLRATQERLGSRPWGVGILGFVPPELRAEQLAVIRAYRPTFALIAGGRPDQAAALEAQGIPTYLHVPSPGLLKLYLKDGARRFVFEGRECGGHVGPRTSFVLWDTMVRTLLKELPPAADAGGYDVLFAGGVHDGRSAAMVAATAAPLADRGVRVGTLLGTAYLFTEEAVRAGAITEGFQRAAVECDDTVLLETGPGHATRCLPSPYVDHFFEEQDRLRRDGLAAEDVRNHLEMLNIGRLRIAAKGVDRNPDAGATDPAAPKLVSVDSTEQWRQGMYMIGQVAALRDRVSTIAELHDEVSAGSSRRLAALALPDPVDHETAVTSGLPPADIAIVGLGCILPGASDVRSFWANVVGKVDAVTEIPADRWDWRAYYDPDPAARDKVYSRWGGFVDAVPFDPVAFGMPPTTLGSIEPFQLLGLLVAKAALEDAGLAGPGAAGRGTGRASQARLRTSVFIGAGGGGAELGVGYTVRATLPKLFGDAAAELTDRLGEHLPEWTEDSFAGVLMNVAAGRIANRFDLGGTNLTVDAACASSLAAVTLAVRDLQTGMSDVAVVGGVDAIQNPFAFLCFAKTHALSPTGRCRPFDATADGIAISEGFAAIVLKRREDAERDGDRIYAVIRGVGSASDGRDRSLTAPRPEGQMRALRRAYAHAGFSPGDVGLVEAHGTGTVAGDRAEVEALTSVFADAGAGTQQCALGSVKSMIGHTKATAGVAGLVKAALALHHQVLPPTLGVTEPNPKAGFASSPFYVNTEARPWVNGHAHPRRAGVSAFGFGGTNFHIVLEEYTGGFLDDHRQAVTRWPAELLLWRAGTRAELLASVEAARARLEAAEGSDGGADLATVAAAAAAQADATAGAPLCLAVVAESVADLAVKLAVAAGVLTGDAPRHHRDGVFFAGDPFAAGGDGGGHVAFLFPGQGSQRVNMAIDLALAFPGARARFERADQVLAEQFGKPLSGFVFPVPSFRPEEEQRQQAALTETNVAQPALAAADLAYAQVLRSLGAEPTMVAGHSFGELVALAVAGSLTEDDLLRLAEARGRFIVEGAVGDAGGMVAVDAPPERLAPLVAGGGLVLANMNAPEQTVLSGGQADIERALAWCKDVGLAARRLPVACGFHSHHVAGAQQRLAELLASTPMAPPVVPVYSNTTAGRYPDDPASITSLLSEHLVRPVEFVRQIEAMHRDGCRVFVEVGPRTVLTGLVRRILAGQDFVAVSADQPGRPGLVGLLHCLGALAAEGVPVRARELFRGRETSPAPAVPPTAWLVDGGRARPAATEVVAAKPVPVTVAAGPATVPAAAAPTPLPATAPAAPRPTAGPVGAGVHDVVHRHQLVMRRFLDVQQTVMAAYIDGQRRPAVPTAAPAPAAEPPAPVPAADASIGRFVVRTAAAPPVAAGGALAADGTVVIVDGPDGVGAALAERLRSGGHDTVVLSPAELATARPARAKALVHLTGDVASLFHLAQALGDDLAAAAERGGAAVLGTTAMGGSFGFEAGGSGPEQAAVVGFLKSLAQEWPQVRVKAVDLPAMPTAGTTVGTADLLLAELLAADGLVEVGYDQGRRVGLELVPAPVAGRAGPPPLDHESVVLVTGGARGITAEVALTLAQRYQPVLVLVGRTTPQEEPAHAAGITEPRALREAIIEHRRATGLAVTPAAVEEDCRRLGFEREVRDNLDRLRATGTLVEYVACDVRDPDRFGALIDGLYATYGRLDGVIHGAGVIEDKLVRDKDPLSFDRVFGTKVDSARVLAERLRPESLRFLVLFSSVSGRFGNRGQADYAAASEVLNKLAHDLDRRWPGRVVSINWGPWRTTGMVSGEIERQFARRGVALIPVEVGCERLDEELRFGRKGEVEVVIAGGQVPVATVPAPSPAVAPPSPVVAQLPPEHGHLPLLGDRATLTWADGGRLEAVCRLHAGRDHYLDHHRVDGRPVLPFAVALELMAEVAAAGWPGHQVTQLREVRLLKGVTVDEDGTDVRVVAAPRPAAGPGVSLDVSITAAAPSGSAAVVVRHYRAVIELDPRASVNGNGHAARNGAFPLDGLSAFPMPVAQAYDTLLFHGPLFQAITSIEGMDQRGARATICPSVPFDCLTGLTGDHAGWLIDPIVVDAALQVQVIWARLHWDVTLLPTELALLQLFGPLGGPSGPVAHESRIRPESSRPLCHTDHHFYDHDGRLLVTLTDMVGAGSAALNRLAGART